MSRHSRFVISVFVLCLAASLTARQKRVDPADPATVVRISMAGFQKMYAAGQVFVVDVRGLESYAAGRIPGSLSVPLPDVERRAEQIKTKAGTRTVVTYCSCPAENSSAEAALILSTHGMTDVRALVGGYPEWVRSGGKIEMDRNGLK